MVKGSVSEVFISFCLRGGETPECCCELARCALVWEKYPSSLFYCLAGDQIAFVRRRGTEFVGGMLWLLETVFCVSAQWSLEITYCFSAHLVLLFGLPCFVGDGQVIRVAFSETKLDWVGCVSRGGGLEPVSGSCCDILLFISFDWSVIYGSMGKILGVWWW